MLVPCDVCFAVPSNTNFTIAFDLNADPYELVNLAHPNTTGASGVTALPPGVLAQLSAELWAVATCVGSACP